MPELNTSSLPDLVFAFLFFIMMVTTIREVSPKVQYSQLPNATELTKLEEKSLVTYIYIGKPTLPYQVKYGTKPCIQLNDQITLDPSAVYTYVKQEEGKIRDERRKLMTVSIKGDKEISMKVVSDVKEQLRKANVLNVNYSARKGKENR
ncbi:hypothetical protein PORCRE_1982 [Porphyromonas crevioricanis JCM 15906]|nr:hypothetical protein PORCRE_1982 [Porphyromonas crevioricanis JCM 15906]GAD06768.1 hypothetical protein PORCAN_376 [Porphyromonas crevioricanis JCM 13913]